MSDDRSKWRSVTEIVAALSVIIGLLLVVVEIRDSTSVSRAEARRDASAANIDFLMQIAMDPDLTRLWAEEWTEEYVASLSTEDRFRVLYSAIALTLRLETVYVQYKEGVLDSASFGSYGMEQPKLRSPWFQGFWKSMRRPLLDDDFVAYIERANGYAR